MVYFEAGVPGKEELDKEQIKSDLIDWAKGEASIIKCAQDIKVLGKKDAKIVLLCNEIETITRTIHSRMKEIYGGL